MLAVRRERLKQASDLGRLIARDEESAADRDAQRRVARLAVAKRSCEDDLEALQEELDRLSDFLRNVEADIAIARTSGGSPKVLSDQLHALNGSIAEVGDGIRVAEHEIDELGIVRQRRKRPSKVRDR